MTNPERQQSLEAARSACNRLKAYRFSTEETLRFQRRTYPNLGFFCSTLEELIDNLIAGFQLLDAKEQAQAEAGKKGGAYGSRGGRPKKTTKAGK